MTPTDWTQEEWDDLLDLWAEDTLSAALCARVEERLASDAAFAHRATHLRETIQQLRALPATRPDARLARRVLGRLLWEHDAAQPPAPSPDFTPTLELLIA